MRRFSLRVFLLGLLTCLIATGSVAGKPASLSPGRIQSYDIYRSWFVVCDNGLTCIAKGFRRLDEGAEMKIERAAGPAGALTASITFSSEVGLDDVKIDGKPAQLAAGAWQVTSSQGQTSITSHDLNAIRALVKRLRPAWKLTAKDGTIPLRGFSACMLRLDERQGRTGGVTALFRPGPAPASQVPAPPPLPRIPIHPITATLATGEAQRLISAVRASQSSTLEQCDKEAIKTPAEAHALDATRALVLVPCFSGAYQDSSLAFIVPRNGGTPSQLILTGSPPYSRPIDALTEADFDPGSGVLSMSAKGRGLADCGLSGRWTWNGQSFQLSAFSLQQACGGVDPGAWPALFRSVH